MEDKENAQPKLTLTYLPWIVAGVALVIYLWTLNHWVTLFSLPIVAQVTGWDWWSVKINSPLHYAVTFPISFLPADWQPVVLNILAALFAVLTLALLARSVALLPHDRTREQRVRERSPHALLSIRTAWLPPVFAVLVCGLQLSFWEHATAGTGEMLNLLLFAYVIRCLLEYRISDSESWLSRLALVYGMAIVNNWAMIGFLPAFAVALIWIKGRELFRTRLLMRLIGYGCAGLSLYLLLPLVESFRSDTYSFWQLLRFYLGGQQSMLLNFPRTILLLAGLTSIVPVLLMGIRWPSTFGDVSVAGNLITTFLFRLLHAVLLVACVAVAFDLPFSPRGLLENMLGLGQGGIPMLTFYYLGALAIGYYSGYFLLVYGETPERVRHKSSSLQQLLNPAVTGLVWLGCLGAAGGLIYKNYPVIQANKGDQLYRYGQLTAQSLPQQEPALILSDEQHALLLLQGVLKQQNPSHPHLLVFTPSLRFGDYRERLTDHSPELWPGLPDAEKKKGRVSQFQLGRMVANVSRDHPVFYLQPSAGYYLERAYYKPRGLAYELQAYETNQVHPPPMSAELIRENEAFWKKEIPRLTSLTDSIPRRVTDLRILGNYYSRALNYWGVKLQRQELLDAAGHYFETATRLNPENVAANINRQVNEQLRQGQRPGIDLANNKSVEEKFGRYRSWESVLDANGPFDEPQFCLELGQVFAQGLLYRQAAHEFDRAWELDTNNLEAGFWLAGVYSKAQRPQKVLEVTSRIQNQQGPNALSPTNQVELVQLEAWAYQNQRKFSKAEKKVRDALGQFQQHPKLMQTLSELYFISGDYTNALETIDRLLQIEPENTAALLNEGSIHINLKQYDRAVQSLTRLLEISPESYAGRRNRALAYLKKGDLDAAKRDYEALKEVAPEAYPVYYGLGEIAYQRGNIQTAIQHFEDYLEYAPEDLDEAKDVAQRLEKLKAGLSQ